jgi:16S rRNA (cytidine1402-2'-O)-methyltransferase
METGQLLVCATPIGNLGDVTLRVLDALRDADVVAAEDTRVTRKLFARYENDTTLLT